MLMSIRVGCFVVAGVVLSALACSETFESKYETGAEALKADVGHGWMPAFLPNTATEITEIHDLDSNDYWGAFNLAPPESLSTFCKDASKVSDVLIWNPGVSWWPKHLKGNVRPSRDWTLYRCAGSNATLIAPADGRTRYFWAGKG